MFLQIYSAIKHLFYRANYTEYKLALSSTVKEPYVIYRKRGRKGF